MLKKVFRDLFTGRNNRTYDIGRVLWFQSIQAFILISIYALYKGGAFDPVLWGAGLAALLSGGGAAIGLKSGTEPNHDAEPRKTYMESVSEAADQAATIRRSAKAAKDDNE